MNLISTRTEEHEKNALNNNLIFQEILRNLNIWVAIFDESSGIADIYFPDGKHLQEVGFINRLSKGKREIIDKAMLELNQTGFATLIAPSEAGDRIIRSSISIATAGPIGFRKLLAINSDVTEKLRYEELEAGKEQMAQIQKFAQGIAHDFGNISQSIRGFSQLLSDEVSTQKGILIIEQLQIAAKRALKISKKISEIAKIKVLENIQFDLQQLIIERKDQFIKLLPEGIELDLDLDELLDGLVYVNPEQIERIIENIIENACHAIDGDGKITIKTFDDVKANRLVIAIANNGPAIPRQIADHIFMPFTSSRKEGGTGLGLYLAYEYLHSCGGDIALKNKNHDVEFQISLPRTKSEVRAHVN